MVIALVMAGGKGSRMNSALEKPLIECRGKPLILHILNALENSLHIERILVATSKHTPKTRLFLENNGIEVIETPGKGYVADLSYLLDINEFNDQIILTIVSDLPLITGSTIDRVISYYMADNKSALSVMVPVETFQKLGLKPSIVWQDLVPSGLNILRGKNNQQDEELLILDEIELAYNINSYEDIISLDKMGQR
jgi:adenosylcobinamide-phosphate guanylyltransferase